PKALRLAPVKPVDFFALSPEAASANVPELLEALAAVCGVTITPALKNELAGLANEDAVRLIEEFIGEAKQRQKALGSAGKERKGRGRKAPASNDKDTKAAVAAE